MMSFKKLFGSVLEAIGIAGVAVVAVLLCRHFVFNPYSISGTSMSPSFHDGDYVFVDQLTTRFRAPERGEVVVFHGPTVEGEDLVKRIVGLPGERIVIKDGKVVVFNAEHPDGMPLEESYLSSGEYTAGAADVALKAGEYFVLGDNRPVSFDSRSWGPLDGARIVGRVLVRIWPPETSRVFAAPKY